MIGALVGGGLSILGGIIKSSQAKREQRKLESEIENYQRQKLQNVADGLQVSTLGAEFAREQSDVATATLVDAIQSGGQRAIQGSVAQVQQGSEVVGDKIMANLDTQQKEIDRIKAEDQAKIRTMQEQREIGDLAGLGNQLDIAKANKQQGTMDIFSGITSSVTTLENAGLFEKNPAS